MGVELRQVPIKVRLGCGCELRYEQFPLLIPEVGDLLYCYHHMQEVVVVEASREEPEVAHD